ncbi:response regulator receiver protein [Desulfovibrio sp. X2]|uniref:response regulator n=1 Tax=Desulfovibrio sp. X2 TaxID=941449 RepID=UPI000358BADE|nr:response regulator [Desulfovibrio sp. X2]EPR41697.1 response regulator receiver protein [Desulfovibrio sp. X2]
MNGSNGVALDGLPPLGNAQAGAGQDSRGQTASVMTADAPAPIASILVAEDDAASRFVLEAYLRRLGFHVMSAVSWPEVLEAMAREHFDLVILDIGLPVMDGMEVLGRIRAESFSQRDVAVIVQTGYTDSEDVDACRTLGCDDFIAKPYDPEDLLGKVLVTLMERGYALQA